MEMRNLMDYDDFVPKAINLIENGAPCGNYVAAIVDEIQDLTEATMKFIRLLIPAGSNDLFLVGDGLQRIYPGGYNLGKIGIDISGRGTILRRNYRNTQQILLAAHTMMENIIFDDMDEELSQPETPEYSVRNGKIPKLLGFPTVEKELHWVSNEITKLKEKQGYSDKDFAIIFRSSKPYENLINEIVGKNFEIVKLSKDSKSYFGEGIKITSFHSAKGLEFKVVFVVGVTDGWLVPKDNWDLDNESQEDYWQRERRLLYVAMTRARDLLYITWFRGVPSRFLNVVPENIIEREY